jgi:hypothetical protein
MWDRRGAYRVVGGEPEGNRHLEDQGVEGKITLKLIFKKLYLGMG